MLLFTDADVFAGTERHIFDLANGINTIGSEAIIASPSPSALKDRAEASGLKHIAIQKSGLIDRPAISKLRNLLKNGEIDIVHAHNGRTMLSAAIAVTAAGKGWAVATQHFLEPDHAARRGARALVYSAAHRWVSGKLSFYIAISEAVKDAMLRRNEAPADRIHIVHNGMPPVEEKSIAGAGQVRRAFDIPPGNLLVVCAARLEKEKDIGTLIRAIAAVTADYPDIICLIAGAGSMQGELEGLIEQLSMKSRVKLLGFREDILSLIGACDLFVLPSLAEPFGLVILEAMSLRKPVIATNAGGPREIVVNGSTGLLTQPANPDSLAHAILSVCKDRELLAEMGKRGFDRYQEMFTSQKMSQNMNAIYGSLVQSRCTTIVR